MKRTTVMLAISLLGPQLCAAAQEPGPDAERRAQGAAVTGLLAAIVEAEKALGSVRLELRTTSELPGAARIETRGELRVLRGTQPGVGERVYCDLEYSFGEGLGGRMTSARTAGGIEIYEDGPAFGAAFLHIPPAIVADLEWAGEVLDRSDLPGMADTRAGAPLGSALIRDLLASFELVVEPDAERDGEAGTWLRGKRRQKAASDAADVPLWDAVELFVRAADHAVVSARYLLGAKVLQEIVVDAVEVDAEMAPARFVVDGRGLRRQDVRDHAPMWQQIERVVERAEARAADDVVRPSRRR